MSVEKIYINPYPDNVGDISKNYSEIYTNRDKDASYDFREYMTRSLIQQGFLKGNSDLVASIYKDPIEQIFNKKFRNIFMYNKGRNISYTSIKSIKDMNIIGMYDFGSSILTPIVAKFLPLIEPFTISNTELFDKVNIDDKLYEEREVPGLGDEVKKELVFIGDELTDEQKIKFKVERIEKTIDNNFISKSQELIKLVKDLFEKYELQVITEIFSIRSESYERSVIAKIYNKLVDIIKLLVYRISIDENIKSYIEHKSIVSKIIDIFVNKLSNIHITDDMLKIDEYFSEKVLTTLFEKDSEFLASVNEHYKIDNPIIDNANMEISNPSKISVVGNFFENLVNIRTIFEEANNNETNENRLFGYFCYTAVTFIQSVFYNAYLLNDKIGMDSNIATLLTRIVADYDKIIPGDEIINLFKSFKKDEVTNESI